MKVSGNKVLIWAVTALILVVTVITLQSLLLQKAPDQESGASYTYYNNFLIFRGSFYHLTENQDLYSAYPSEHYDLYKYSPTFAVLIAPVALLPAQAGLFFWNLLNGLILFIAFWKFPSLTQKQKLLALALVLIELITSLQNSQSNALLAGLFLLAFVFMEKNKPWIAILFIILTVFIKIFGLVALSMLVFYPKKIKNGLIAIIWLVILFLLPLLLVDPSELIAQYRSWMGVLGADASLNSGLSVMSWLKSWFGIHINKNIIILAGAVLLLLPLVKFSSWKHLHFRILFLASIMIWMVIFNHMAESPTYVIAVSGVALWFFSREKMGWVNTVLLALVLLFTVLSPTDIFPSAIRESLVNPYILKAVPCIFVWIKIQCDLFL